MGKRLYVGNLSFETTEEGIRHLFSEDGRTVGDIHVVTDRETGRPRGFAFVEMGSEDDAQKAIEALDGRPHEGRDLRVNEAQERAPRAGGGGGGFGGGGRSGGYDREEGGGGYQGRGGHRGGRHN
ncbi:MAG: RNA-binding protein [Thermoanaerobaculia bacterium]